ncbi:hypothetical protein AMTRI_Chr01g104170 [Amborella trichopoda]
MASDDESPALDVKPLRTLVPVFLSHVRPLSSVPGPNNPPLSEPLTSSNPRPAKIPQFPRSLAKNSSKEPTGSVKEASKSRKPPTEPKNEPSFLSPEPLNQFKPPADTINEASFASPEPQLDFKTPPSNLREPIFVAPISQKAPEDNSVIEKQASARAKRSKNISFRPFDAEERPMNVDRDAVDRVLTIYHAYRRRLMQQNEPSKESSSSGGRIRADLKAGTVMASKEFRTNVGKRVGSVPGVNIGDIFYFRLELGLVGLHAPSMAGIDYMTMKFGQQEDPIAISIVSSGSYDDDDAEDNGDTLIYSGHGGVDSRGKQVGDQKLERGNLALEKSLQHGNEIRVIKGVKDVSSPSGKAYIYDGLYRVQQGWTERGTMGFKVFKYKLLRCPGQPNLGSSLWKQLEQWRENPLTRPGATTSDVSSMAEKVPVCLVNDVDDEKRPRFLYITGVRNSKPSTNPSPGCMCVNACSPNDINCCCLGLNGGQFPYNPNGILFSPKPMIYECAPTCLCSNICRNRASQNGLKLHFEVFKTRNKGWGLRSWNPIPSGTFICEYAGLIMHNGEEEEETDDEYLFLSNRERQNPFNWANIYTLLGEQRFAEPDPNFEQLPIVISAKRMGNVSRFMNHSCSPNVSWYPVLFDHRDSQCPHIMFFAIKNIPPMTELTYDYGLSKSQSKRKQCLCGALKCRGFFG